MSGTEVLRPKRVIVVAYARNHVIGRDDGLPWQLSSDLKHFKAATMGRPMIMGRKTFASIGRALPGRTSIVVTRDTGFAAEGILVAPSIEAALEIGDDIARRDGVNEVMITGGGQIYAQALPYVDRVIATEIALEAEGPVLFPVLDSAEWGETARVAVTRGPRDDADYDIVTYDRLQPSSR